MFWVFQASYDQVVADIRGRGASSPPPAVCVSARRACGSRGRAGMAWRCGRGLTRGRGPAVAKGKGRPGAADSLEKELFEVVFDVLEVSKPDVRPLSGECVHPADHCIAREGAGACVRACVRVCVRLPPLVPSQSGSREPLLSSRPHPTHVCPLSSVPPVCAR